METVTKDKQSLLAEAFDALVEKLGPERAIQVWQILVPSQGDYSKLRQKLFADKDSETLDQEIREFDQG